MSRPSLPNSGSQSSSKAPVWTPSTTIVPPGATSSMHRRTPSGVPAASTTTSYRPPSRVDAGAQALAGLLLVGMAGVERDVGRALVPSRRHGQQPDRARPDDRHGGVGGRRRRAVPRATATAAGSTSERVADVEPVGQRDEAHRGRTELLGHATVGEHAECPAGVLGAQVVRAALALRAVPAAPDRLDRVRAVPSASTPASSWPRMEVLP